MGYGGQPVVITRPVTIFYKRKFVTKAADTRGKLIATAASLFKRQGYHGTGLNQLLETSETPKGSFYFHFPGGKEQLATAAVEQSGAAFAAEIGRILERHPEPAAAVAAVAKGLSRWIEKSGFVDGCPITTVCLEMAPSSASITDAACQVFRSWRDLWRVHLEHAGFSIGDAEIYAVTIVSSLEGAFILARVEKSSRPFDLVAGALAQLVGSQRR
jgi:TetR/AcrR family transcriptional regulator, lmrAB and yxaGH operons repressor